jgi:hypothetical protein
VAADPNITATAISPVAADPDGVTMRRNNPDAANPDPTPLPRIVSGSPNVIRARGGDDYFLRRYGRSLVHHDLTGRSGWRRTLDINYTALHTTH